jgi:hypothetical protein
MVNGFVEFIYALIVDVEANDRILFGKLNGKWQANVAEADDRNSFLRIVHFLLFFKLLNAAN